MNDMTQDLCADCGYLFPVPSLADSSDAALFAVIEKNLQMATENVDGRSEVMPEQIDVAQDVIAQCRDLLVARGVEISAMLRGKLEFLQWPLAPAEHAAQVAARERNDARQKAAMDAWWKRDAQLRAMIRSALAGHLDGGSFDGCELSVAPIGVSGREVLALVKRFEAVAPSKPKLGYVGSRVGIKLEDDAEPSASISVGLSNSPRLWRELIAVCQAVPINYIEVWDHGSGHDSLPGFHGSVEELFPSPHLKVLGATARLITGLRRVRQEVFRARKSSSERRSG